MVEPYLASPTVIEERRQISAGTNFNLGRAGTRLDAGGLRLPAFGLSVSCPVC